MTLAEVHVKRSVVLTDRLGPDIASVLNERTSLARTHLKVPGCSFVLSALRTKKVAYVFVAFE